MLLQESLGRMRVLRAVGAAHRPVETRHSQERCYPFSGSVGKMSPTGELGADRPEHANGDGLVHEGRERERREVCGLGQQIGVGAVRPMQRFRISRQDLADQVRPIEPDRVEDVDAIGLQDQVAAFELRVVVRPPGRRRTVLALAGSRIRAVLQQDGGRRHIPLPRRGMERRIAGRLVDRRLGRRR